MNDPTFAGSIAYIRRRGLPTAGHRIACYYSSW